MIESEDQFAREFGEQIEKVAPGVYRFTSGSYTGKVVAIGEDGLAYNLAVHRARVVERAKEGRPAGMSDEIVRELEKLQRQMQQNKNGAGHQGVSTQAADQGSIGCSYWPPNSYWPIEFYGAGWVVANAELYHLRSDGSYSWYYARSYGEAYGYLNKPWNVPDFLFLYATTRAENRHTGEVVNHSSGGITQVYSLAGPVYSGPVFSHDLYAFSQVYGNPQFCRGYVSIADEMVGVKFP